MTVHLMKMAVGIESVDHLKRVQKARLAAAREKGGAGDLRHMTRNMPKRADEVLDGGSIYWVIKGYVRVRQRIKGFDWGVGRSGRKRCAIILDPKLVCDMIDDDPALVHPPKLTGVCFGGLGTPSVSITGVVDGKPVDESFRCNAGPRADVEEKWENLAFVSYHEGKGEIVG